MPFERTSHPRAASAADAKRHDQIRAAVEWASGSIPGLPPDYADRAIASGKSVEQVKAALLDQVNAASPRERSKANMVKQIAAMRRNPHEPTPAAAGSRASMVAELARQGLKPAGA